MTAEQFSNTVITSLHTWWEERWLHFSTEEHNSIILSTQKALTATQKVIDEEGQVQERHGGGDAMQLMFRYQEHVQTEESRPTRNTHKRPNII